MNLACILSAGYADYTNWNGGTIYGSIDNGGNWLPAQVFVNNSVVCRTNNTINISYINNIDYSSVLNVNILSAGTLSSITFEQLLNASNNLFAYGKEGRWEIIQAMTCTLQSNGSYNLSNFLPSSELVPTDGRFN